MSRLLIFQCFIFISFVSNGQQKNLAATIDSLIAAPSKKPFNGMILIAKAGKTIYSKSSGYADFNKKTPFQLTDQFVIGSISKQLTAVIVLREVGKKRLLLTKPIRFYLPELTQPWADTITVHQLLTHTHGIVKLDQPLKFKPGSEFLYSQIGYDLLARIVERTSGKSFADISNELFKTCGMMHSVHPSNQYANLVKCYTEQTDGNLRLENSSLENYPAAGSFISTATDLASWNKYLNEGNLLMDTCYQWMITKQKNAVRQHPVFGKTCYGYGITVDEDQGIIQIGQTGFAPGFVSVNYYYPATKTSLVVLENIAYDTNDLKKTFYFHTELMKILKNYLKKNNF